MSGISQSTASYIFECRIQLMFVILEFFFSDGLREIGASKKYSTWVLVIIISKVFGDHWLRRSVLRAAMRPYGESANMLSLQSFIKFLISITLQGLVTLVSHAWGGRILDKLCYWRQAPEAISPWYWSFFLLVNWLAATSHEVVQGWLAQARPLVCLDSPHAAKASFNTGITNRKDQ